VLGCVCLAFFLFCCFFSFCVLLSWSRDKRFAYDHRHTIDKYLDALLADQTARKASPAIIPEVAIARWRSVRVIISLILPNQSQRNRSSATANDVSSAVRRIAKRGMRKLRPSRDYHRGVFSGSFTGIAAVDITVEHIRCHI